MENASTTYIVLKELAGNPPTSLNALQSFLAPYVGLLTSFWTAIWIMTAIVLLAMLLREYRNRTRRG